MSKNLEKEVLQLKIKFNELQKENIHLKQRVEKLEKIANIESEVEYKPEKVINYQQLETNRDIITNERKKIPRENKPKKQLINNNVESIYGKNIMSVLASILIFIGLASFVVLIYKDLTETMKLLLMYLFSGLLFGIGLWRVNKNKNGFSLALSGCGIGSIYISLLLSHFYFDLFGELPLFILMIVWSSIVALLSQKIKSDLFVIISYAGLLFALLLGGFSVYGESGLTLGLLLLLQCIFIIAINNKWIKVSDKLFTIFPFMSLVGSFLLSLAGFNQINYIFDFSKTILISDIFYLLSVIALITVNLFTTKHVLNNSETIKIFVPAILIFTCIINMCLITTVGDNIARKVGDEEIPYMYSLIEAPEYISNDELEYRNELKNQLDYYNIVGYENLEEYDKYEYDYIIDYLYDGHINKEEIVPSQEYMGLLWIICAVAHLIYFEINKLKKKSLINRNIITGLLLATICFTLSADPKFSAMLTIFGLAVPAGLILLYSYLTQDKHVLSMSLIFYFIGMFAASLSHDLEYVINFPYFYGFFVVLQLIYLVCAIPVIKSNYTKLNKILYYIITTLSILFITNIIGDCYSEVLQQDHFDCLYEYDNMNTLVPIEPNRDSWQYKLGWDFTALLNVLVMSIYCFIVRFTGFAQNWKEYGILKKNPDSEKDITYKFNRGITCILLLTSIALIHEIYYLDVLKFLLILLGAALCFVGTKELVDSPYQIMAYYVGLKITFFINAILASFIDSEMGYLYSIVCLLISVAFIVMGFYINKKSFRLYGLILSMISILKLILIDISYTNSISRILSFIFSGLLCFFIVWLYSKLEGKTNTEVIANEENTQ